MICGSGREDRSCDWGCSRPRRRQRLAPKAHQSGQSGNSPRIANSSGGRALWLDPAFVRDETSAGHHCGEHGPRRPHFRSCGVRHQGSNWPTRSSGSPIVMDGLNLNATWADLGSRRQSCRMQELFKRTTQSRKRAAEIDPGSLYDIADRNRLIGLFQPRNQAWFKRGHSARDERRLKRRSRAGYSKRK